MNNQPHLDSRDVRIYPADPGSPPTIADLRAIASTAHRAGLASGYETGQRAAQTEIDSLAYERGIADERARVVRIVEALLPGTLAKTEILRAIRSGEEPPR